MQIANPLQMNDWGIKRFLTVVLGIQAAVWVVIILDVTLGWQIPVLTQIVGVIYLLFIPGMLILRIFKLHKLGAVKSLLFSIGLSVAAVMFIGLLINTLYPLFGISQPITTIPLTVTFSIVIVLLSILSYFRDRAFCNPGYLDLRLLTSPPALLLYLLPFLSILGTYLVNEYQNNILLMALIAIIALTVILVGFKKFIPESLYPLAIFSITLSLLFFRSLISFYISGYDIHEEYASATLVQSSGYWDPSTPTLINGLLAINILPVTVADISGLSMTMVFKVMYPLLFSIACVGLYQLFKSQTNAIIAFIAVFFIVSAGRMYYDLALIPRQLTASLFLVVSIALIVEREILERVRVVFLTIMGFSMILAHYGLAYIYLAILLCSTVIQWLARNIHVRRFWNMLRSRLNGLSGDGNGVRHEERQWPGAVAILFIFLFVVIIMGWYMYTAGGTPVSAISHRLADFAQLLATDLFHSTVVPQVEAGITTNETVAVIGNLNKISIYIKDILIIIGCLAIIWGVRSMKLSRSYLSLCVFPVILFIACLSSLTISLLFVTGLFLIGVLLLPALRKRLLLWLVLINLATICVWIFFPATAAKYGPPSLDRLIAGVSSDVGRLQNIALLLIAIFLIAGITFIFEGITKVATKFKFRFAQTTWGAVITIFLACTLFLDTGFVLQATGNYSSSPSLNQAWVEAQGNVAQKAGLYSAVTPEQDVVSAEWLGVHVTNVSDVFATFDDDIIHPLTSYGMISKYNVEKILMSTKEIPEDSYIYLQYLNVVEGIGTDFNRQLGVGGARHVRFEIMDISHLWSEKNKIYTNGGSEVYR